MKKLDIKLIVIFVLILTIIALTISGLYIIKNNIKEVEKIVEIEKEVPVLVHDTIPFEIAYTIEVPYKVEVEKIITVHDTIQIEKIVEVKVEVVKQVEKIVEVERAKTNDWYLGLGYDFGTEPFFAGAGTRVLYKTKNDIMFGGEFGFRNNITNFQTMEGIIKPYVGGVVYLKLNK